MKQTKHKSTVMGIGAILILIGAALVITGWFLAPYLYCAGALLFAAVQLSDRYEGDHPIVKRLRRQQIFGSILLLATGVLMFAMHDNEWILSLTIAAVLELYTAFRMPSKDK